MKTTPATPTTLQSFCVRLSAVAVPIAVGAAISVSNGPAVGVAVGAAIAMVMTFARR
jgi:hypothetical protein